MTGSGPRPVTAEELPLRVPLIHGETLASYLRRTAAANGRDVVELLAAVAGDTLAPAREDLDPQQEELHPDAGAELEPGAGAGFGRPNTHTDSLSATRYNQFGQVASACTIISAENGESLTLSLWMCLVAEGEACSAVFGG